MVEHGIQEIAEGIYWLGLPYSVNELHCNSYCIVDGDEAVLIDPGSVLDFDYIQKNLLSLISLDQLKYMILHHQDPDLCSAIPLYEKLGIQVELATHWRTSLIVKYYGLQSPFYMVNEHDSKLVFGNNRVLEFYDAPYLHFPGAITTFDSKTGTLFSGDVFGAIGGEWSLYADESYMEVMKSFHEHYVPSNEVIRPVMDRFMRLPIKRICPQHGSIIENNIKDHILALRNLECGVFLDPIKREIARSGGITGVVNQILKRLISTYGKEDVQEVFAGSDLIMDHQTAGLVPSDLQPQELWDKVFFMIYSVKGIRWLTVIEPLVRKVSLEYDLEMPEIFQTALAEEEKRRASLKEENIRLKEVNKSLRNTLKLTREEFTKDPVTGLYNEDFFVQYFLNLLLESKGESVSLLFIGVDNMAEINTTLGEERGDEILHTCGYLLLNEKAENHMVFRLDGPIFLCLVFHSGKEETLLAAEQYRLLIERSSLFSSPVSVSVGVVSPEEQKIAEPSLNDAPQKLMSHFLILGKAMLSMARKEGGNTVIDEYRPKEQEIKTGRVLVLEYDDFHAQLLKESLETLSIEVRVCMEGGDAVSTIKKFHPDIIISEIHLLETDIFQIRQALSRSLREKEIPIVIVSHQKDEASVGRALNLGILHYLKKPYMISELLGLVDQIIRKRNVYGT